LGYRIGNTDSYSQYNGETGDATPFFSMGDGNNDFRFPHSIPSDIGAFYKLGGKFNTTTRKWIEKRTQTFVVMTKQSVLTEIETGEGITVQID